MAASQSPTLAYKSPDTPGERWPRLKAIMPYAEAAGLIAALASAAIVCWTARLPIGDLNRIFRGMQIGLAAGGLVGVCTLAELFLLKPRGAAARKKAMILFSTLLVLATAFLLLDYDVPEKVMFRLNRPALDAWAKAVVHGPSAPPPSARVGMYDLRHIALIPGGVQFEVEPGAGYALSPGGVPDGSAADEWFTPRGGGWYLWVELDGR
jgi:hypothetical protein